MNEVKDVLEERGSTYGSFADNAELVQNLKRTLLKATYTQPLPTYQQEAIDMVFHKIARIVYGDRNYIENWRDIVGYTQLALDEVRKSEFATDAIVTKLRKQNGIFVSEDTTKCIH